MLTPNGRHLGGKRSPVDNRDRSMPKGAPLLAHILPRRLDPRYDQPTIWNQQTLGSCTFHGGGRALAVAYAASVPGFMPCRLDGYYRARAKAGTIADDSGCMTRDMLKILQEGLYDERYWPYDVTMFMQAPPILDEAMHLRIASYSTIKDSESAMEYLASGGVMPFAMALPDYFETAFYGIVRPYSGGVTVGEHCMAAVGYDLGFRSSQVVETADIDPSTVDDAVFIVANSWGSGWGDAGYCYIPMDMVLGYRLGGDAWAVQI
jgi:hypothetical protein